MLKKHLLIVDDDKRIRKLLKQFLTNSGYRVSTAGDAATARELYQHIQFDMLILDIMMPGENGLSLTRTLSRSDNTPILLLSARVEASDRILGLEMGADDYLAKPFEPRELLLRVEAILKRSLSTKIPNEISVGHLKYNITRQELWSETHKINLTSMETKLMQTFAQRPNSVLTRDDLAKSVSNKNPPTSNEEINARSIDVSIKRLRQKIEKDSKNPSYLKTIRGFGYILEPD
jgi:two-component system phosphate regulon response regulator OmpR